MSTTIEIYATKDEKVIGARYARNRAIEDDINVASTYELEKITNQAINAGMSHWDNETNDTITLTKLTQAKNFDSWHILEEKLHNMLTFWDSYSGEGYESLFLIEGWEDDRLPLGLFSNHSPYTVADLMAALVHHHD